MEFELEYLTKNLKGTGGKIKETEEDFIVDEIPVYSCSEQGDHLFVNITKKGKNTQEVSKELEREFGLRREDVGVAGLKDKNATTSQCFSLYFGKKEISEEEVREKIEKLGLKFNWMKRHENKLKAGHLYGNNFKIKISELGNKKEIEEAEIKAINILKELEEKGVPNYYGEQRFGRDGDNWQKGLDILGGKIKVFDRFLRGIYLSSVQSRIFNLYLSERIKKGKFTELIDGDICKKTDTGGIFISENFHEDNERSNKNEISFTGPMLGDRLMKPRKESDSYNFEEEIIKSFSLNEEQIKRLGEGTRRVGRIFLKNTNVQKESDGLWISFFLPKGSFATIVLGEIMKEEKDL